MYSRFAIGDTFELRTTLASYPASSGWVLKIRLIKSDGVGTAIDITCAADGDEHVATVAAATTAAWAAGTYAWASWVERSGTKHSVSSGSVVLLADPRTAVAPVDLRSTAAIALEQARAAFTAWKPTVRRYTINGREMEFNSASEILKVISYWQAEVNRERAAGDRAVGRVDRRKIFGRVARA